MRTEHFERAWPLLEPAVLRARQHTRDTVWKEIDSGRAQLWMLDNSVAVTRLHKYANGRKSFAVWLLGGDLDEICAWAQGPALQSALADSCDEMRIISGRRGWVRAFGWRDVGTVALKDLGND